MNITQQCMEGWIGIHNSCMYRGERKEPMVPEIKAHQWFPFFSIENNCMLVANWVFLVICTCLTFNIREILNWRIKDFFPVSTYFGWPKKRKKRFLRSPLASNGQSKTLFATYYHNCHSCPAAQHAGSQWVLKGPRVSSCLPGGCCLITCKEALA